MISPLILPQCIEDSEIYTFNKFLEKYFIEQSFYK